MKKVFGFTLMEVLIVIVIIVIITIIAIPAYQNNIVQTQIGIMFHDAEAAKLAVTSDYYRANTYTSSTYAANSMDFTTKNSDYVSSIVVASGVITIQGDGTKLYGKNIWIKWTPSIVSNDLSWQCSVSTDAAAYVGGNYCP